jgi:hypothetical protein
VTVRAERVDEATARRVVSDALGVSVELYDDGTREGGRMVDALFTYPDGRKAALEVVSDVDVRSTQQFARLARDNALFSVAGLSHGWYVSIGQKANIDKLVERDLVQILGPLEAAGAVRYEGPNQGAQLSPAVERLAARHGIRATRIEAWPAGRVILNPGPWVGSASMSPAFTSRWVSTFLVGPLGMQKASKLRDHEDVDERHIFIWATNRTDMSFQVVLEGSIQLAAGVEPPTFPEGISHLWIGGMTSIQGVVAWFPDRGWWRTPWKWPLVEALPD